MTFLWFTALVFLRTEWPPSDQIPFRIWSCFLFLKELRLLADLNFCQESIREEAHSESDTTGWLCVPESVPVSVPILVILNNLGLSICIPLIPISTYSTRLRSASGMKKSSYRHIFSFGLEGHQRSCRHQSCRERGYSHCRWGESHSSHRWADILAGDVWRCGHEHRKNPWLPDWTD